MGILSALSRRVGQVGRYVRDTPDRAAFNGALSSAVVSGLGAGSTTALMGGDGGDIARSAALGGGAGLATGALGPSLAAGLAPVGSMIGAAMSGIDNVDYAVRRVVRRARAAPQLSRDVFEQIAREELVQFSPDKQEEILGRAVQELQQ